MSRTLSEFRLEQKFRQRILQFTAIMFAVTLSFILQLGDLQLIHGSENRMTAVRFVSRQEFTIAPRGIMFDRNFTSDAVPLVKNVNYIDFVIYPAKFRDREEGEKFLKLFASVMGRPFSEYQNLLEPAVWKRMSRRNEAVTLITRMTRREHERLAEFRMISQFGSFITNHLRYYTMGPALAHVSGYVGLPSRRELDMGLVRPYQILGKSGLEARYDTELRGTDGIRIRHRIVDSEEQLAQSEQGNNLILTIDREMQAAAYNAVAATGLRGTVIAMKPATGEILTMVSLPAYDPNILSSGSPEQRNEHIRLVSDHNGFLNLAIQGKFPPASTFKPVVAIAALETNKPEVLSEATEFSCSGRWVLSSSIAGAAGTEFFCWKREGHGRNDLIGAMANSCNVYFYQLGSRIGPSGIIEYAKALMMNQPSGIDLPGEATGFVPDQRWKQITWSSRWYDGDTVNLAIGQGFLETTPIGMAQMYSGIINNGKIYRPALVKSVRDPLTGQVLRSYQPYLIGEAEISQRTLDIVKQSLRSVVTSGTARSLERPNLPPIAGKTGTAQTRSKVEGRNHAWFAGYGPVDGAPEDQILVVVFMEFGMGGAATAVPVAGKVFEAAFPGYKRPPAVPEAAPGEGVTQAPVPRITGGVN